jgi:plasmid stabilization system protein ParE
MDPGLTLLARTSADAAVPGLSSGFPVDLLTQSARRLRVIAVVYAVVFFLSGVLPALLYPPDRALFLGDPVQWLPSVAGITLALIVAAMVRCPPMAVATAMNIGLVFEVVSSYAIAAAEFADPAQVNNHQGYLGLSWVAVWVVLFTIVVPSAPRKAVAAALASVSAVSVIIGYQILSGATTLQVLPAQFFIALVFPYLIVVGMAYVGARVVYQLGTEIKRARELGSYQLEEKLGEGGMGEVWRARHRMLARPAAIKLIRPALAGSVSQAAVQRFEREAQVIARLRSPHTVTLFDFGVASDGAFYYAMELLEGLDTDSLVKRFGPIAPDRAIHLLRQVCHSLSEAQSCGLVHRDIKPANVFLCKYGEEFDFVKVLDFGIVRAMHDVADTQIETQEHILQGTPAFMSPEQAMGGEVDGRADIYALGCLAYWLLTGKLVFTSDSPMGQLLHHVQTVPLAPSAVSTRPIPGPLDQLVLACLEKDPARRPQSARELSQRLAAIAGASAWTSDNARVWWETHPFGAA